MEQQQCAFFSLDIMHVFLCNAVDIHAYSTIRMEHYELRAITYSEKPVTLPNFWRYGKHDKIPDWSNFKFVDF